MKQPSNSSVDISLPQYVFGPLLRRSAIYLISRGRRGHVLNAKIDDQVGYVRTYAEREIDGNVPEVEAVGARSVTEYTKLLSMENIGTSPAVPPLQFEMTWAV